MVAPTLDIVDEDVFLDSSSGKAILCSGVGLAPLVSLAARLVVARLGLGGWQSCYYLACFLGPGGGVDDD